MDVCPSVLYSNLLADLKTHVPEDLLAVYLRRKDFPVGLDPLMAAAVSIGRSLLKKYRYPASDDRDSRALLKFLDTNERCRTWTLQLSNSHEEELLGEFKDSIYRFWHEAGEPIVDHPYDILS